MPTAIIIGASSGIGLALATRLAAAGWTVTGLARRESPLAHEHYRHIIADVRAARYRDVLVSLADPVPDLCVYASGIGHEIDLAADPTRESDVFATNLLGAVIAVEVVVARMLDAGAGHFIGLSSQADRVIDRHVPSYAASKAGLSSYLEGLALACRRRGVVVTNVRLGFVDTAMAKARSRPFMVSADRAARVIEQCIRRRPIRKTFPLRMAALLWFFRWGARVRIWVS